MINCCKGKQVQGRAVVFGGQCLHQCGRKRFAYENMESKVGHTFEAMFWRPLNDRLRGLCHSQLSGFSKSCLQESFRKSIVGYRIN